MWGDGATVAVSRLLFGSVWVIAGNLITCPRGLGLLIFSFGGDDFFIDEEGVPILLVGSLSESAGGGRGAAEGLVVEAMGLSLLI